MESKRLETALLEYLDRVPELESCGFSIRRGLTGAGVTVLQGRNFFGNWTVTCGTLVWTFAGAATTNYFAKSVEDAARHTMLVVLRRLLEQSRPDAQQQERRSERLTG